MSINWVMLSPTEDFVRLPSEQKLYNSPARVSISLDSISKYPGRQPYHLSCDAGKVHLTNRRIIYIPTTPPPQTSNQAPPTVLASFAAPFTHLHDTRVTTPWLGPNAWVGMVQPVIGGGIPSQHAAVELRLTFKDGGAYDFHTRFCELRERLAQFREVGGGSDGLGGAAGPEDVHLEQLPAYEERGGAVPAAAVQSVVGVATGADERGQHGESVMRRERGQRQQQQHGNGPPLDSPPGYEEAQRNGVEDLLEINPKLGSKQG